MSKRAIVLGINGMDGRTLTHILLSKGYQVIGTYRRNTIDLEGIRGLYPEDSSLIFEYCNIDDFDSVKGLLIKYPDVNETYLLAAQSHVGFSFKSAASTVLTDGMGVFNVLENVKNLCPSVRTYFAATSELFGGRRNEIYNEESPFDCKSPYSIGKELGTRWVKYYRDLGLFCCYGILFNHSNIYRSKDFFIRRVTNSAARIALGLDKTVKLGNLHFFRDEHWSDFGCEMMWKMLQNDQPKDYVVATGQTHYGEEFLERAFDYFNLNWIQYVELDKSLLRPNEVFRLKGDSTKAQKELGWRPSRMSFHDHIELMCAYDWTIESGKPAVYPDVFKLYP
jgi:GDPmannose 4,6-dehydratase